MKSSIKAEASCCVMVLQKPCNKHEEGCKEPYLAIGWIVHDDLHDSHAQTELLDALEQLGFSDSLAKRV